MYSTCLFCNRPLGTNEVIEPFPVGRRLAFDAAKGRLWVVCRKCERWNLSPLEERWEALEDCERRFRAARLRMSTDNVGLARLTEGLELVRIGEPLRPEFAAWRYGDQFGRRRRRAFMWSAAGIAFAGAIVAGGIAVGVGGGFVAPMYQAIANIPVRVRIKTKDGRVIKLKADKLQKARFLMEPGDPGWSVLLKYSGGEEIFKGEEAVRVTGLVLPGVNHMAGSKQVVRDAVDRLESAGDPERLLKSVPSQYVLSDEEKIRSGDTFFRKKSGFIHKMPKHSRLALEMALHEEQERRALAGELLTLEAAWREAEEVANIADNLLVPKEVDEFIERHRPSDPAP